MSARLWEIDVARTCAIGLMVAYHAVYDVDLLAPGAGPDPHGPIWQGVQTACGALFLALVGMSFGISDARARARGLRGRALWWRHARRGGLVLGGALLISAATLTLGTDRWVRFGILHLIATLMLLVLPLTVRLGAANALLGVGVLAASRLVDGAHSGVPGALVLGFDPGDAGVDWYPLLPWGGAALIGLALAAVLYPAGTRGRWLCRLEQEPRFARPLGAPGRHSLPVYLVHQPLLVGLIAGAIALGG